MKYRVPQSAIVGPVLLIFYAITLQYVLNYYTLSYNFYADDTQMYFKLNCKFKCDSKLDCVSNAVQTCVFENEFKLGIGETNIMVVGNPLQKRNYDMP